ncbi:hypothetical protein [Bacillus cereus]
MNSKKKIKADLEEQLNYIQGLKFEHSTKKLSLLVMAVEKLLQ